MLTTKPQSLFKIDPNPPRKPFVEDGKAPLELFSSPPLPAEAPCDQAMNASLGVVRRRHENNSALRTTAGFDGNDYVVNGEKLFISNVIPRWTAGLVCLS